MQPAGRDRTTLADSATPAGRRDTRSELSTRLKPLGLETVIRVRVPSWAPPLRRFGLRT